MIQITHCIIFAIIITNNSKISRKELYVINRRYTYLAVLIVYIVLPVSLIINCWYNKSTKIGRE